MNRPRLLTILAHLIGWLMFQSLPMAFMLTQSGGQQVSEVLTSVQYWQFFLFFVAIFYIHNAVLPFIFKPGKRWIYIVSFILMFIAMAWLRPFEQMVNVFRSFHVDMQLLAPVGMRPPGAGAMPPQNMQRPFVDVVSVVFFLMIVVLGALLELTKRWRDSMQRAIRAEADRVQAELSFLRAQINPHFLFNTLNNIYSMAMTGNQHTAGTIMKLSNIMRYVTDEAHEDFVSLQNEVDCISDYIDLQQLRLGKKVKLAYSVKGDLENKHIAPLLLMTFIENVFKYGTSNHEAAEIIIAIEVEEKQLRFFSQNPLFATGRKAERTGIGIANTRKRLHHLYPGHHQLSITRGNNLFSVHLTLDI